LFQKRAGVTALAHLHRWRLFTDLHQVSRINDIGPGDQIFNQANAFQM
jgi:hypothetical protein